MRWLLEAAARQAHWDPEGTSHLLEAAAPVVPRLPPILRAWWFELRGRCAAVVGDLTSARGYFAEAAPLWREGGDPVRAEMVTALSRLPKLMPLSPVAAIEAETALVLECLAEGAGPGEPLLHRALLELTRQTAPLSPLGLIEARFSLSPGECALLGAALTSVIRTDVTPRDAAAWGGVLAGSLCDPLDIAAATSRLVRAGLCTEAPLVPKPAVVSFLFGRGEAELPVGLRVAPVPAGGDVRPPAATSRAQAAIAGTAATGAKVLASGAGIVAIVDGDRQRRAESARALAGGIGWRVALVEPVHLAAAAAHGALVEASLEAHLGGALLAVDVEAWTDSGLDVALLLEGAGLATIAPLLVLAGEPASLRSLPVIAIEHAGDDGGRAARRAAAMATALTAVRSADGARAIAAIAPEVASAASPERARVAVSLAVAGALAADGGFDDAEALLAAIERVVENDGDRALVLAQESLIALELGDDDVAVDLAGQAIELAEASAGFPELVVATLVRQRACERAGEVVEAYDTLVRSRTMANRLIPAGGMWIQAAMDDLADRLGEAELERVIEAWVARRVGETSER